MEKRVIKFNLMGAIGVLILIIAAIVGITVFVASRNNSDNKEKNSQQIQQQDADSYKEVDMKETVEIDGEKTEFIVKPFESELKYKMNLATEKFYFDANIDGKDIFKSLESDSILIEIFKTEGDYKEMGENLINGQNERRSNNDSYRMNAIDLNGKLTYIDQEKKEDGFHFNYYIEGQDSYYTVQIRCDESFVNQVLPVVDKMLQSFEIM